MWVIFLDWDGVLNSRATFGRGHRLEGFRGLDPQNIKVFNLLMKRAEQRLGEFPKVVISSSWRVGKTTEQLRAILAEAGMEQPEQVIGRTGIHFQEIRGLEIQQWLEEHGSAEGMVILDDVPGFMAHFRNKLVQTSDEHGLRYKHIDRALKLLLTPVVSPRRSTG